MGVIFYIFSVAISLFILYMIIETAVRNGINSSRLGKILEEKYGREQPGEFEKSWLDRDLDN